MDPFLQSISIYICMYPRIATSNLKSDMSASRNCNVHGVFLKFAVGLSKVGTYRLGLLRCKVSWLYQMHKVSTYGDVNSP